MTAIDISEVALSRARAAADRAGAGVHWVRADALQVSPPARAFDLVSLQYPALPRSAGEAAVRALCDSVHPGGMLLAVYHDLDAEHREHMKAGGTDPADFLEADELVEFLVEEGFTIELHVAERRLDPPSGTPHVDDVVVRARRR